MKIQLKRIPTAIFLLLICPVINCQEKNTIFKPGEIWPDTEGNHINAHDESTHVLEVQDKKNIFIFMGDRWVPQDLTDSRYIWLPVEWEDGAPIIKWYPEWELNKLK